MKALVYDGSGTIAIKDRPKPEILEPGDAIVRVSLSTICTSDLHIIHGAVPRALPNTVLGHEFVGVIEQVGENVTALTPGDRVGRKLRDILRRMLLLRTRLGEQLRTRRVGAGLPHRRLPSGVRARPFCRTDLQRHS